MMKHILHNREPRASRFSSQLSNSTGGKPAGSPYSFVTPLYYRNCKLSLTEVAVVELARLDPDGGAGAEVDAEADHVVQLKV